MDDDTNLSTVQFSYSEFQKVWNRHGEFSLRKRKQGGLLLYLINLLFGRVKDIQKKTSVPGRCSAEVKHSLNSLLLTKTWKIRWEKIL